MAGFPWYKWWVERWLSCETRLRMNMEQRGLYREALDIQSVEGSIPRDLVVLRRLLQAEAEEMERSWPAVQSQFVPYLKDRLINLRLKDEIEKRELAREKKIQAGVSGGKQSGKVRQAKMKQMLLQNEADASKVLHPQTKQKRSKNEAEEDEEEDEEGRQTHLPIASANGRGDGFEIFYSRYPRKVAKRDARKAYRSVISKPSERVTLEKNLPAWLAEFASRWTDKIPYPASFLRSGQWIEPPPPRRKSWGMTYEPEHPWEKAYQWTPEIARMFVDHVTKQWGVATESDRAEWLRMLETGAASDTFGAVCREGLDNLKVSDVAHSYE